MSSLEPLGDDLAHFLSPSHRRLRRIAAADQLRAVRIACGEHGSYRLDEWPGEGRRSGGGARLDSLFAATASASHKIAGDLGLLVEGNSGPTREVAAAAERAMDVAALDTLRTLLEPLPPALRAGPRPELADQVEAVLDRLETLRELAVASLGDTPVPGEVFGVPLAPADLVPGARAPARSGAAIGSPGAPRWLAALFAALAVVAVLELAYLRKLGEPPPPASLDAGALDAILPGSHVVGPDEEAGERAIRVAVGDGWATLDERARRETLFRICQVLGGHSYATATFVDDRGGVVGRWADTRIVLPPPP